MNFVGNQISLFYLKHDMERFTQGARTQQWIAQSFNVIPFFNTGDHEVSKYDNKFDVNLKFFLVWFFYP